MYEQQVNSLFVLKHTKWCIEIIAIFYASLSASLCWQESRFVACSTSLLYEAKNLGQNWKFLRLYKSICESSESVPCNNLRVRYLSHLWNSKPKFLMSLQFPNHLETWESSVSCQEFLTKNTCTTNCKEMENKTINPLKDAGESQFIPKNLLHLLKNPFFKKKNAPKKKLKSSCSEDISSTILKMRDIPLGYRSLKQEAALSYHF